MDQAKIDRARTGKGFIAALDQSGGSTPNALAAYGVGPDKYSSPEQMLDLVHEMRVRIATSPSFDSRIIGAILFEDTMRRDIAGVPAASYFWDVKHIVPYVKIDKGLAEAANDVQLLNPIPGLDDLLSEAAARGIFGTKERSLIHEANAAGIQAIVEQQFEVGEQVIRAGLAPILEPEVSIASSSKAEAEELLLASLLTGLGSVSGEVLIKLTLPEQAGLYRPLIEHPKVIRVVALSGGYPLEEACRRLDENHGMIASFSRALSDGLSVDQSAEDFNGLLDRTIGQIANASST